MSVENRDEHTSFLFQLKWLIPSLCFRSISYFYWLLAFVMSVVAIVLTINHTKVGGIDSRTFDTVMKMRWETPSPSQDIVLLDIDEKSLAQMSQEYGRFPWKREVFAEVLAELEYEQAQSIIFSIMITDPDKGDPKSDAVLSYIASESFVTVYPLVRLDPQSDVDSKLKVCDLIPAGDAPCDTDATVAAILPGLPGMRHDMGMLNHHPDIDGVVRKWELEWQEEGWKFPTMAGAALTVAGVEPKVASDKPFVLNWRGDEKPYQRISFSDYMAYLNGEEGYIPPGFFTGKHVIIGASADGLTVFKNTSVGMKSDGELLATALDDAINGTNLKPMPPWMVTVLTILFMWGMAYMFVYGRSQGRLDKVFVIMQSGAVVIMALTVNYTTYFLDLAPLFKFAFYFFVIGRIHHSMGDKVFMGDVDYLTGVANKNDLDSVGVIVFKRDSKHFLLRRREMLQLQEDFPGAEIFFCHNSFETGKLLEGSNKVEGIIVMGNHETQEARMDRLLEFLKQQELHNVLTGVYAFPEAVMQNKALAAEFMAQKTLYHVSQLPLGGNEEDE